MAFLYVCRQIGLKGHEAGFGWAGVGAYFSKKQGTLYPAQAQV
jgi:hypothetical protein